MMYVYWVVFFGLYLLFYLFYNIRMLALNLTNTEILCFCSGSRGDARAVSMTSVDSSTVDVEAVKAEWTLLWQGRIDDKVRAQALCVFVLTFDLGWIWV